MSLIVKIILLGLAYVLSAPVAVKTQYFAHWSFNSSLQLINDTFGDLQKLPKYFNDTAIVALFRIPFAPSTLMFSNNLDLYLKD